MAGTEKKLDQLIEHLEIITPYELVQEITQKDPTKNDQEVIENIQNEGLPNPVVNAILYYMLLIETNTPWTYIQKVSEHFSRNEVRTAKQAMNLFQEMSQSEQHNIEEQKLRDSIIQAIHLGYDDEQLGQYVRSIVNY